MENLTLRDNLQRGFINTTLFKELMNLYWAKIFAFQLIDEKKRNGEVEVEVKIKTKVFNVYLSWTISNNKIVYMYISNTKVVM